MLAQKLPVIYFPPFISQRAVYFPDLLPFISRGPSISHNVPRISRTFISHIIRGHVIPVVYVQGAVYFPVHLLPRGRLFPKWPFISRSIYFPGAVYFPSGHLFPMTSISKIGGCLFPGPFISQDLIEQNWRPFISQGPFISHDLI